MIGDIFDGRVVDGNVLAKHESIEATYIRSWRRKSRSSRKHSITVPFKVICIQASKISRSSVALWHARRSTIQTTYVVQIT